MQENKALMKKEITGETHYEELVQKIEECVESVASKNLYTPAQTLLIGFNIIYKWGFYSDGFRYCRRKSKLDKTWPNFKVHFAEDFKETRDSNKTAGNSGYANLLSHIQSEMQTMANENVQALANLSKKVSCRYKYNQNTERSDNRDERSTDARERKKINFTYQVGNTRQDYSRNNNE